MTKQATATKTKATSNEEFLKQMGSPAPKAKGGKVKPTFIAKTMKEAARIKKIVTNIVVKTVQIANLEADVEIDKEVITGLTNVKRAKDIRDDKLPPYKSVYFEGMNGEVIKGTNAGRFSKVPKDVVAELKEVCESHGLNITDYFDRKLAIGTKAEVSEEQLMKVVSYLRKDTEGTELLATCFDVYDEMKLKGSFDEKQFELTEEVAEELKTYSVQNKTSIRTK